MIQPSSRALPSGYSLYQGSTLDRAKLLKFMYQTYAELAPQGDLSHLSDTVEQYFSRQTPLWWVAPIEDIQVKTEKSAAADYPLSLNAIACLWLGTAIDQLWGDRYAHIFLLYVSPAHRRQGIGAALMGHAETWARQRGDRQIGLQVFQTNQPALNLYQRLGYEPQSLWLVKLL